MIISHKHEFIFIKTFKTAGTSMEIWLSTFCGPNDVITPISERDEDLRRQFGGRGPQNYLFKQRDYTLRDWLSLLKGERPQYYNHMPAHEIIKRVKPELWKRYFKFCFERNPWDRTISYYYWWYRDGPRPSMEKFLRTDPPRILNMRGYDLYTVDGEVAVDKIYKYEELTESLRDLCDRFGISEPAEFPHAKGVTREPNTAYRDMLDDKDKDTIAEMYSEEVSLLRYEF